MKNAVILKMRYLGDVLLLVPVIRKLRLAFPGIQIAVVANVGTEYPLTLMEGVRVVVFDNRSMMGKLRGSIEMFRLSKERTWDLWIDWTVSDRSRFLTRFANATRKVISGWKTDRSSITGNALYFPVDFNHGPDPVMVQYEHSLAQSGIVLPEHSDPVLSALPASRKDVQSWKSKNGIGEGEKLLVMHPGGRQWYKRWPPDRFSRVGNWWTEVHNGIVAVSGSKDDQTLVESVVSGFKKETRFLVVQESIPFLHALMESSALFLGNDSGPFHLADASGLYGVVLFGSTTPAVWGPISKGRIIPLYDPPPCSPCTHEGCGQGIDNCLRRIDVDSVIRTLSRQLDLRSGEKTQGVPS